MSIRHTADSREGSRNENFSVIIVSIRGRMGRSRPECGTPHSTCCGAPSISTAASPSTAPTSVPPYPASHGCARVSIAAMNWMWTKNKIPLKTSVWVYRSQPSMRVMLRILLEASRAATL